MPRNLVFQFPKNYDAAVMGQFVLAINQVLIDMENNLKGTGGGESIAPESQSSGVITLSGVVNNLPIGRGNYFEFMIRSNGVHLTGMSGGSPGRIVVLKNADGSNNQITIDHNSNASSEGNRFIIRNEINRVMTTNAARAFIYLTVPGLSPGWYLLAEVP